MSCFSNCALPIIQIQRAFLTPSSNSCMGSWDALCALLCPHTPRHTSVLIHTYIYICAVLPTSVFPRLTWSAFNLPLAPCNEPHWSFRGTLGGRELEWNVLPALPFQVETPKLARRLPTSQGASSALRPPLYPTLPAATAPATHPQLWRLCPAYTKSSLFLQMG